MIPQEQIKLLEDLKNTSYGKALEAFLQDERAFIEDIRTCKTLKEMEGRQFALKTLDKLFYFMGEKPKGKKPGTNQYL